MKRVWLLFFLLGAQCYAQAQHYPPEWVKYTFEGYMYDIQSDNNHRHLSETEFKNYLLSIARTNLAKQIQVQVQDAATLNKKAIGGRTSISYFAQTRFSTDVNLKLVETKTMYDVSSRTGYAIAYVEKSAARNYYANELALITNKQDNSILLAEDYIQAGFKAKAKQELEASLIQLELAEEPLFLLNIFGASQSELAKWRKQLNSAEQKIKSLLAELKYGTIVHLACSADLFGAEYPTLQNELKGVLSLDGCSFTDNPLEADWVIAVTCKSRKYSNVNIGKADTYFSYVDARIVIDKVITSQRIYENEISVKGGHIFGYADAAKAAYKEIKQQIGTTIIKSIKQ